MKVVRGRVVLKDTGAGVAGVVAAVEGVRVGLSDGANVADAPIAAEAAAAAGRGALAVAPPAVAPTATPPMSLGTRATADDGSFEVQYDDGDGRPVSLRLSILAPDEPGSTVEARTLFTSGDLRLAGATEEYLIALPADALTKAGVPLPPDPSLTTEHAQADAVIARMQDKVDFYGTVGDQARSIAAGVVSSVRAAAAPIDAAVEEHFVAALTGISPEDAARFNFVVQGASAEPIVWSTVNRTIDNQVNASSVAGYVVFSEQEAQQFRNADGTYKKNIPGPEIEPYIFQADDTRRPISIVRDNPLAALQRLASAPDPLADTSGGTTTTAAGDGQQPVDVPIFSTDLPKFVGRLVGPMVAPEDGAGTIAARPSEDDVQASVHGLALQGGPADVTAYYDFHQLQIAFDYVWQQALDAGAIDAAKALCRQLADQGGDPVAALQGGGHPLVALRDEVRFVTTAQQSLQGGGIAYRLAPNGRDSSGDSGGKLPLPPKKPGVPPIVRPPFVRPLMVDPGGSDSAEPGDLLAELEEMLSERYSFEVFAPGSTNFGLMLTYRQRWDPLTYQVGNLAKTLTLAPKETRKVTSKRTVKVERSIKEMEDNQRNRKDETSNTMRDEAEIVRRAEAKTSFSLSAKGSYDIGISGGDVTTTLGRDAASSSQETKKQYHEATLKAAQDYHNEHKMEVETKVSDETETTDSVELTNPNDELTVTYLFYELQRRYQVSEQIHRLTPVVLVALEVPNPNRDTIDKVLLKHSWIINRVLLDDRYRPALNYLCTRVVGDELALQHLEENVAEVRQAVAEMKQLHRDMALELQAREAGMQAAIEARAGAISHRDNEGFFEEAWDAMVGNSSQDPQSAQIVEDAAKDAYERAVQREKDLRMRLDAETAALTAALDQLARARAEHGNLLLQIAALRAHFKENVLYYMQAIWSFTFRDQTFFSLCNVKVPKLTAAQRTYSLTTPDHIPLSIAPKPGQVVLEVDADVQLDTNLDPAQDFVTLAEVADLDSPLGFKGNYMIFPLRQSNPLTDFMMIPYVDSELGLHDPDELGGWTPEDFTQYARALLAQEKDTLSQSDYAALESQLSDQYRSIVSNPALLLDMVIVPTSSLYIEALPGAHPLLENFKLEHRAIDVQKAKAETRKLELENLRYAARLLATELGDPDFDKQVLVTGASGVDVADA